MIGDPTHPEHEEMTEWVGEGFDPARFDADEVNDALRGR
ncbi:MAG: plasmid pRiA4b ORF-3 family protein [Actinomycetota bacterium]|nr:plasmid pRiA4b ORF-3 family protein [Actinomycetota bacterium]